MSRSSVSNNTIPSNFSSRLLSWYWKVARDLPWRRTRDPYAIWVSEIMLQQTTVKAVIPYFERWMAKFPTVHRLAKAREEDVLKSWQGLGYYARARNLHAAARIVSRDMKGEVPQTPEVLRTLPGFGPYTVAAVLSIAYGVPLPLVDANVRRVFQRILLIRAGGMGRIDARIRDVLLALLPRKKPGDFNQALMELGALVCRSQEPVCNLCPVRSFCRAYEKGLQEVVPTPKVLKVERVRAAVAIIKKGPLVLVQRRPEKGLLAGLWEFPGGKIDPSDRDPREALERELFEELGCRSRIGRHLGAVEHSYTRFRVHMDVFEASLVGDVAVGAGRSWVSREALLKKYAMPSGSARILERFLF